MTRFLLLTLMAVILSVASPGPVAAQTPPALREPFDAQPLQPSELRLLQSGLAVTGDYSGPLDGEWGVASQRAFEAYAAREFEDVPINLHAAALTMVFLDDLELNGWEATYLADLGVSVSLPVALLDPPETAFGGTLWSDRTGSIAILALRQSEAGVRALHESAAVSGGLALHTVRASHLWITGAALDGGGAYYIRSDLTPSGWTTVHVSAEADRSGLLNLISASVATGPAVGWQVPEDGALMRLLADTIDFLDGDAAAPDAAGARPRTISRPPDDTGDATGTGFYVDARMLVTADHVVRGCTGITLADGSELQLVAADPDLDVAALVAPSPAGSWLGLAGTGGIRLGQRVHAAGFPYYSLTGTALNVTSGNVSALAGVDDDRRFVSFSAPVQPGNSGGPLIDGSGRVLGVVVARLSDTFIADATGSLPQNVNFALGDTELTAFLRRNGLDAGDHELAAFDMDAGAPVGFEAAVVPIICHQT